MKMKIRRIGNSHGIILPKDLLELLKLKEGSIIDVEAKGGKIELVLRK